MCWSMIPLALLLLVSYFRLFIVFLAVPYSSLLAIIVHSLLLRADNGPIHY